MGTQMVFKRYEIKYRMTCRQQAAILRAMEAHMQADEYGISSIRNIYYDTPDFRLIRTSMEKPVYKEKLRLRGYGARSGADEVFLELKKKYRDEVYKRRIAMPYQQACEALSGIRPLPDSQIGREIGYAMEYYRTLRPAVFLSYDRIAYFECGGGDFRVTFDRNIRFRQEELTLDSDAHGTPLLRADEVLMELKTDGAIPLWMVRALSAQGVSKTSFSKYGTAYQIITQQSKGVATYA